MSDDDNRISPKLFIFTLVSMSLLGFASGFIGGMRYEMMKVAGWLAGEQVEHHHPVLDESVPRYPCRTLECAGIHYNSCTSPDVGCLVPPKEVNE
jgi:hypothetical protein